MTLLDKTHALYKAETICRSGLPGYEKVLVESVHSIDEVTMPASKLMQEFQVKVTDPTLSPAQKQGIYCAMLWISCLQFLRQGKHLSISASYSWKPITNTLGKLCRHIFKGSPGEMPHEAESLPSSAKKAAVVKEEIDNINTKQREALTQDDPEMAKRAYQEYRDAKDLQSIVIQPSQRKKYCLQGQGVFNDPWTPDAHRRRSEPSSSIKEPLQEPVEESCSDLDSDMESSACEDACIAAPSTIKRKREQNFSTGTRKRQNRGEVLRPRENPRAARPQRHYHRH